MSFLEVRGLQDVVTGGVVKKALIFLIPHEDYMAYHRGQVFRG